MKKIIQISTLHHRFDPRIFKKISCSLSKKYNVTSICVDGLGNQIKEKIYIKDFGKSKKRYLDRIFTHIEILKYALNSKANIYHLHDPELIFMGLVLKIFGLKVIFDSHEDVSNDILYKHYIPKKFRLIISKIYSNFEKFSLKYFDALIATTPYIAKKLKKINSNTVIVHNFPVLKEFSFEIDWLKKKDEVVYVGAISKSRGIEEIVNSLAYTRNIKMNLAGNFVLNKQKKKMTKNKCWSKVRSLGFLNRNQVKNVFIKSRIGLVILHPLTTFIHSYPVKMFEYMAAGIPVIASDFLLWKKIIVKNKCGICVNPLNSKAIGKSIQFLIDNPKIAEQMGRNGRKAVKKIFNWKNEEKKLFILYDRILNN